MPASSKSKSSSTSKGTTTTSSSTESVRFLGLHVDTNVSKIVGGVIVFLLLLFLISLIWPKMAAAQNVDEVPPEITEVTVDPEISEDVQAPEPEGPSWLDGVIAKAVSTVSETTASELAAVKAERSRVEELMAQHRQLVAEHESAVAEEEQRLNDLANMAEDFRAKMQDASEGLVLCAAKAMENIQGGDE